VGTVISEVATEYERNGQIHDVREALDSLRKKYLRRWWK